MGVTRTPQVVALLVLVQLFAVAPGGDDEVRPFKEYTMPADRLARYGEPFAGS